MTCGGRGEVNGWQCVSDLFRESTFKINEKRFDDSEVVWFFVKPHSITLHLVSPKVESLNALPTDRWKRRIAIPFTVLVEHFESPSHRLCSACHPPNPKRTIAFFRDVPNGTEQMLSLASALRPSERSRLFALSLYSDAVAQRPSRRSRSVASILLSCMALILIRACGLTEVTLANGVGGPVKILDHVRSPRGTQTSVPYGCNRRSAVQHASLSGV